MALILTAGSIDAQRALALGLVTEVVPQEDLMSAARKTAQRIMRCAPLAVQASKQCVMGGLNYAGVPEAQQAQEAGVFERLDVMLKSDDIREGLNAFLEKRRPQWRGR
jgi:crotonobetainyl-CoA hydratase